MASTGKAIFSVLNHSRNPTSEKKTCYCIFRFLKLFLKQDCVSFLGYPFFNHCFFFANAILKRKCLASPSCKAERLVVIIETEVGGAPLAGFMKKTEEPGKAYCIWCNQDIKYRSTAKVALTDHVKTLAHQKIFEIRKTNYSLLC